MRAIVIGTLLAAIAAAGCGTVMNNFLPHQYPHLYGGVEIDCQVLQGEWTTHATDEANSSLRNLCENTLVSGLVAVDLPLSFVGDTVCLPHNLLYSGFREFDEPKEKPTVQDLSPFTKAEFVFSPPKPADSGDKETTEAKPK
jgi:uncharacterized protein YceK